MRQVSWLKLHADQLCTTTLSLSSWFWPKTHYDPKLLDRREEFHVKHLVDFLFGGFHSGNFCCVEDAKKVGGNVPKLCPNCPKLSSEIAGINVN